MIHVEHDPRTPASMIAVSAKLAGPTVSLQDLAAEIGKRGSVANATMTAEPVTMVRPGGNAVRVEVLGHPTVPSNLALLGLDPPRAKLRVIPKSSVHGGPVIESVMTKLEPHPLKRGVLTLLLPGVPSGLCARLGLPARGMVPALEFRHPQATTFSLASVDRKRGELLTTAALASGDDTGLLCFCGRHAVHYTGKLEKGKQGELLGSPTGHGRG